MVLRCLKDGVKIEGLHSKALQIVQLFHDAQQVAAEKVPVPDLSTLVRPPLRQFLPILVDPASSYHPGGIGDTGAEKAVRKDLIGHPLSKPGGDLLRLIDGELIGAQFLAASIQPLQQEGVPHQPHIVPSVQAALKQVPIQLQTAPEHREGLDLIPTTFKAGGEGGAGEALHPSRAEGEPDLCPGGDRPVGRLVPGVPGVIDRLVGQVDHSGNRIKALLEPTAEREVRAGGWKLCPSPRKTAPWI